MRGNEGRQKHLDREERQKAEVAHDERFEEQSIANGEETVFLESCETE